MRGPETLLYWYGVTRTLPNIRPAEWVPPVWENARARKWQPVFETLARIARDMPFAKGWPFLNSFCIYDDTQYSFLHLAADLGAPVEVVQRMLEMGAWRTLQNALGERPVDIARKRGHAHLVAALEPQYRRQVPLGMLLKIEERLHAAIRGWDNLGPRLDGYGMRLPQLEPLLEVDRQMFRFDVRFWYGGFNYELVADGLEPRLTCFGASRVVGGSEGEVEITPAGVKVLPLGR